MSITNLRVATQEFQSPTMSNCKSYVFIVK